jgi:hypothetical protein
VTKTEKGNIVITDMKEKAGLAWSGLKNSDAGWVECERYKLEEKGICHPDYMLPDGTMGQGLG